MTVSGISSSQISMFQMNKTGSASQAGGNSGVQGTEGNRPPPPPPGGGFGSAIKDALSSLGIDLDSLSDSSSSTSATGATDTSATETDGSTESASAALKSFMHTLMDTLHAQGSSGAQAQGETEGSGQVQGPGGHHHGGHGNIQADMQSLIQKLSSSSSDSTSSNTSDSDTSELQQSFDSLMNALGASSSGSDATLSKFLQALQGNMEPKGTIVNTTA
ncbi:hypothetical protein EGT07_14630 [Herbaspirillum sp. HC18]|nr:hypothetical protein EGT07_14630 [Herbaspirillum sp. HC18]